MLCCDLMQRCLQWNTIMSLNTTAKCITDNFPNGRNASIRAIIPGGVIFQGQRLWMCCRQHLSLGAGWTFIGSFLLSAMLYLASHTTYIKIAIKETWTNYFQMWYRLVDVRFFSIPCCNEIKIRHYLNKSFLPALNTYWSEVRKAQNVLFLSSLFLMLHH